MKSAVSGLGDDEVIADGRFIGPHYAIAAATWLGSDGGGGYEYPGRRYAGRFLHAESVRTCTQCHDPHSLRIRSDFRRDADLCAACHSNVTGRADYREVLLLVCVDDFSYREAAEVLGIPIGTVMSRLARARAKLEEMLE